MKSYKSEIVFLGLVALLILFSACAKKSQYEVVRDYLINDLKVGFDIQNKTYIVISTEQCLPCAKKGIEAIKDSIIHSPEKETKFIIASITEKKALFLLPKEIKEKTHVIVDTHLAMKNIPLFSENVYVKFDIENKKIVNLVKINIKDILK